MHAMIAWEFCFGTPCKHFPVHKSINGYKMCKTHGNNWFYHRDAAFQI